MTTNYLRLKELSKLLVIMIFLIAFSFYGETSLSAKLGYLPIKISSGIMKIAHTNDILSSQIILFIDRLPRLPINFIACLILGIYAANLSIAIKYLWLIYILGYYSCGALISKYFMLFLVSHKIDRLFYADIAFNATILALAAFCGYMGFLVGCSIKNRLDSRWRIKQKSMRSNVKIL